MGKSIGFAAKGDPFTLYLKYQEIFRKSISLGVRWEIQSYFSHLLALCLDNEFTSLSLSYSNYKMG